MNLMEKKIKKKNEKLKKNNLIFYFSFYII